MARITKLPEVRKQEILDTAMRLFYENGYEATSMADIARELHVVQGLCYRYFPSKQGLFDAAMARYVEECCEAFISTIHDRSKSIEERMAAMGLLMQNEEQHSRYHDFYHRPGNEALHEQLTLKICKELIPHVRIELTELNRSGELAIENVTLATEFIMYGQIGLLQDSAEPFEDRIQQLSKFIHVLLGIQAQNQS
jgi:AcrR family transcriptional regulator